VFKKDKAYRLTITTDPW